jgi:hypothetical protein
MTAGCLEEIGNVLADQTDCEHRWLINPQTGETAFWNADSGIDGQTLVDLDDLDLADNSLIDDDAGHPDPDLP